MDAHEALALYDLPLPELAAAADRARRAAGLDRVELCTIVNARSGRCGEDCRYCAQSVRWKTDAPVYPLLPLPELVAAARAAAGHGARHFSIVTSGGALSGKELDGVVAAVEAIRAELPALRVCGSLGHLKAAALERLRAAGMVRYHHNLETSRRFYAEIVGTHRFDDRIDTVRAAAAAGMEVCSGGILGLGETRADRIDLALTLRDLPVCSVPVNVLMPIPGTPLADAPPLPPVEVLKTLAIFRLLLPDRTVRLAGGRETALRDFQGAALLAGVNGMMVGGYLTQRGRAVEDDLALVREIERTWSA